MKVFLLIFLTPLFCTAGIRESLSAESGFTVLYQLVIVSLLLFCLTYVIREKVMNKIVSTKKENQIKKAG
jgi:hypothetical protein